MDRDVIFGIRAVMEALDSSKELNKVMIQKGVNNPLMRDVMAKLKPYRHLIQYVPIQKLNSITRKNHQGIIAFCSPVEYHLLENLLPGIYENGEVPFILVLDRVTDVRNFGAIARTAECMGVHTIVVPAKGGALITGDAIKTSAGALTRLPVCRERFLDDAIALLQSSGVQVVGCTEKAEKPLNDIDFKLPTALVMGSEEDGISSKFMKLLNGAGKIVMPGTIKSLNVSVAAGMAMYEISQQRLQ